MTVLDNDTLAFTKLRDKPTPSGGRWTGMSAGGLQ